MVEDKEEQPQAERLKRGSNSYQKAVILGIGSQTQAQPHVIFALRHVGQRDPSWNEKTSVRSRSSLLRVH